MRLRDLRLKNGQRLCNSFLIYLGMINTLGPLAWKTATRYGQRSVIETTMGR